MIVKDEEEYLPSCLASLSGLVDEVVIYDTGSVDDTLEVARREADRAGIPLTLVEGYWDDDFARARNASLEHCAGTWILWIDADERAVCDQIDELRTPLRAASDPLAGGMLDALAVSIRSEGVVATSSVESGVAIRIFRRSRCRWFGRLHEQVHRRSDDGPLRGRHTELLYLRHLGYLPTTIHQRSKTERNLRIAEAAAAGGEETDRSHTLINLGRTRAHNHLFDEALEAFEEGVSQPRSTLVSKRIAFEAMVRVEIERERWSEGRRHIARLWHVCDLPTLPLYLDAYLSAQQANREHRGDGTETSAIWRRALRCCDAMPLQSVDEQGSQYGEDFRSDIAGNSLAALGRFDEACQRVMDALVQGFLHMRLEKLLSWTEQAGRDPNEIWEAVPPWMIKMVLAQAATMEPLVADRVLEGIWNRWPDDENITAFAALAVAPYLPADRAEKWSKRLERVQALSSS